MKAIRIHQYGGPDALRFEDAARPEPAAEELLVRVIAAGVNPIDGKVRAGVLKTMVPLTFPWIPGGDLSGVIEKVGARVSEFRAGDEVFGKADLPQNGSYAEYVSVPHTSVAIKPRSLDHLHAAAVPLAGLTAFQALFGPHSLQLSEGQSVLILGAGGGVGSFAVQLAKSKGARVIALGNPAQDEHLRELGADQAVDEQHLDDAGEVDAVLDLLGGALQQRAWSRIKQGGAMASTMGHPSEVEAKKRGARVIALFTQTNTQQLAELAKLIDGGKVKVVVMKTFPLAAAKEAHELLENGHVSGKLVLSVGVR